MPTLKTDLPPILADIKQGAIVTKLSHIEINVSDYAKSIRFYDKVLAPLGWRRLVCTSECATFTDGVIKIVLSPTEEKRHANGFHRKNVGLNHLAFHVESKNEVDVFCENVLKANKIEPLYEGKPTGDESYYAVLFEDPDRIKLEVVYAPGYCEAGHWTNKLENDFDPYAKEKKHD